MKDARRQAKVILQEQIFVIPSNTMNTCTKSATYPLGTDPTIDFAALASEIKSQKEQLEIKNTILTEKIKDMNERKKKGS